LQAGGHRFDPVSLHQIHSYHWVRRRYVERSDLSERLMITIPSGVARLFFKNLEEVIFNLCERVKYGL
jgi:hypothetical protein